MTKIIFKIIFPAGIPEYKSQTGLILWFKYNPEYNCIQSFSVIK